MSTIPPDFLAAPLRWLTRSQESKDDSPPTVMNYPQSTEEEVANAITHGVALVLSVVGLFFLLPITVARGDLSTVIGAATFGAGMVLVYAASTIYHLVRDRELKSWWRVADQVCIYLMIAGSYTPFTVTVLRGAWGWSLLTAIWVIAVTAIVARVFFIDRDGHVSPWPYVLMGWLAVVAIAPIIQRLPAGGLALVFAGGISYMIGVYFYLKDHVKYYHAIWHLFVMMGNIFHFWAVLLYAYPPAA